MPCVDKESEAKPIGSATAGDELGQFLRRTVLDAYTTADRLAVIAGGKKGGASYPESELGRRLGLPAGLIKAGLGTRVYYLEQGGYDTTRQQLRAPCRIAGGAFRIDPGLSR